MLQAYLDTALGLAREAGQQALHVFHQPELLKQRISWKADASPVTATDQALERYLRTELSQRYPEHGILGEEYGASQQQNDYLWILDPIDGTRSFARGIPVFGIQLALCYQRQPVLGVIALPALGETVAAAQGLGCRWNGRPCKVSDVAQPEQALVYVHERELARERCLPLGPWLTGCQLERNWGDCYSFVQVITGRAEAALDPRMQVWDSAPLPVLVQEAGGQFFDWQGNSSIWSGSVVVSNAALAPVLKGLLSS